MPDKKMNIGDIMVKLSNRKPGPEKEGGLPRAIIEKLHVLDGTFKKDIGKPVRAGILKQVNRSKSKAEMP